MDQLSERLKNMTPLQRAVFALKETQARLDAIEKKHCEPIAIVGMACRFPGGGTDPASYWKLLCDGVDAIRETPSDRWDVDAFYDPDPAAPGKMNTRWGGFLERIDEFDNHFFGISDREAQRIDPQQRMLLELSWEVLEDAGVPAASLRGTKTGVYVGIAMSEYGMMLSSDPAHTDAFTAVGTSLCLAANRVSFVLGLSGPSVALDTACSSALVAVHMACQNIRNGECEAALAGGANLLLSPVGTINLVKAGFCASDGRVRAFDAAASGYVRSEGVGMVLLKPLSAALKNHDRIYAVIRGSAVNQNSTSNGLTAPSRPAQEQVLREAYAKAQVSPGLVQYVETQGTGTPLGDAIEAIALGTVLRDGRDQQSRCSIGSVKTNLGHLEAASGIASLIKVALALTHRQIPPTLHFRNPNPDIPFAELPLTVQTKLDAWPDGARPRLAGVSALGFGGSNAHVVLEEAPADRGAGDPPAAVEGAAPPQPQLCLLPLSARTETALSGVAARWHEFLRAAPPQWCDVCHTAAVRRDHHDLRLAILTESPDRAAEILEAIHRGTVPFSWNERGDGPQRPDLFTGRKPYGRDLKIAFTFGSAAEPWKRLGQHLRAGVSAFSAAVDEIDSVWRQVSGWSLSQEIESHGVWDDPSRIPAAVLVLQLGLAAWWRKAGVSPNVVLGHGAGELAAACFAGIITAEEALHLVAGDYRLQALQPRPAKLPFLSAADGAFHSGPDLPADYWQSCLERKPASSAAAQTLRERQIDVCLEIGPDATITAIGEARQDGSSHGALHAAPLDGATAPNEDGAAVPRRAVHNLLSAVGRLYVAGAGVNWSGLPPSDGRCVRVPTYPWQRQALWAPMKKWTADGRAEEADAASTLHPLTAFAAHRARQDALSEPAGAAGQRPELTTPFAAPRSALETDFARLWSALLRIAPVGIDDNFFELGGDSLQATILLNQLQERLGETVSGHILFQAQTIRKLADHLLHEFPAAVRRQYPDEPVAGGRESAAAAPSIPRVARAQDAQGLQSLPVSFAQQRLWLLAQLDPDNPVYNIPLTVRLTGKVDAAALHRTLNEIVARHETLRTRIVAIDGQPVQVVEPAASLELTIVDLSDVPAERREAEAFARAEAEVRKPFRLDRSPLFRSLLLRLSATDHILVAVMHHIISDDWSMGVLFHEVSSLYKAFTSGRPSPLPQLPIQYADYADWQRRHLRDETLVDMLDYWRGQLQGLPALELPTDRPRPPQVSYAGATHSVFLPRALADRVREIGRREGATLYMTLLTAFNVLLGRYSGQEEFGVGSPIAGRVRRETEGLVGFFVNTLVMRARLEGNPSFRDLLRQVRQTALEAFQRQEMPFDRLVEALNPVRDTSRHPLFQVALSLQSAPWPRVQIADLALSSIALDAGAARFELWLSLRETEEGLRADLEYCRDLFDADTARRFVDHYRVLLEAFAADPDQPIGRPSLLTPEEERQVLVEWNATQKDYQNTRCLHELVELQVARSPDIVAVDFAGRQLTYRELNARANQLARYLARFGVGPDVPVGVCLERSLEMVVGLLAILKAGGAYAPLDPDYPAERLAFMIRDSRPAAAITTRALRQRLPEGEIPLVVLEDSAEEIAGENDENLPLGNGLDDIAYLIYTSGSTGTPKGVRNTHRGIGNRLLWMQDAYGLTVEDRVLQKTPFSFDVSVWEFFWPLSTGARLVLAEPGGHKDPRYLAKLIDAEGITTLHFVPSMLRVFLEEDIAAHCRSVKRVICSGEALPYDVQERFFAQCPAELFNLYGPTEAAIDVTAWKCRENARRLVPIGKPIANIECYILDSQQNPTPVGVPGELHLGGVGLARDYLNRAELTAQKFIAHPFSSQPGSRLYRTGDLCRYLPDGNILYIGRTDTQVKIRGNRVELGEIDAALAGHPGVAAVVTRVFGDDSGNQEIVAFWVARDRENPPPPDALRALIEASLPVYMIPAEFVLLEAIPLSANGKVDYKALIRPDRQRLQPCAYVPPRNPDEELLVEIWRELLHVDRVGIHDNFFALGGHSLLATQVVSRIGRRHNVELPLRGMFQSPTVAGLAELIAAARSSGKPFLRMPIVPTARDAELPLSFTQEALWFLDQLEHDRSTYTVYPTMRLRGPLDVTALERAMNEVLRRHESLRTRFPAVDGRPMQVIDPPEFRPLPVIDLTALAPAEREAAAKRWLAQEYERPIDLQRGPLIRVTLLKLSEKEYDLVAAAHHMIYDGWSLSIMSRDLTVFYEAHRAGRPALLPELPAQYADFAAWQRNYLQGETLETLQDYWSRQLAGVPPLDLPNDYPRPAVRSTRGDSARCELGPELSAAVREFGRREGATPFMVLLAVFELLLSQYSGQDDFAVGSPVANRMQPETENLIGYFINMLALRADLSGGPTFRELVQRVRNVSLEAFEHQELTLDRVVQIVKSPRDLSRHPLFQAMFVLQNNVPADLDALGVQIEWREEDPAMHTAYFELALTLWELPDGFRGTFNSSSELFRPEMIERMSRHYLRLLTAVLAEPDRPLPALPLVDDAEKHTLLVEWNDTASACAESACICGLFEAQARRTPDAVALVDGLRRWTYRELDAWANRLAHCLQARGAAAERIVAVRLPRSAELIAALWGVLKSGAAYLPLDPQVPRERLHFMLADAAVDVAVTLESLRGDLPESLGHVVCMDAEAAAIAACSSEPPPRPGTNDHLAYVIYTSGSTGLPKGVMIDRRALASYAQAAIARYDITCADRVLQFASVSFDAHVEEVYTTLTCGGRLVLRSDDMLEAKRFLQLCEEWEITLVSLPTAYWHELAATIAADRLPVPAGLRMVIIGGERALPERVAAWFQSVGQRVRLVNSYGPSEATVVATAADLVPADGAALRVPIGRPLANMRAYVLDRRLQPVPVGVHGELYLGGKSVARGYLNRPELTAEAFLPDPFADGPGNLVYKTGDIVRWTAGGGLEFVGRTDQQVKIRGFRVEPGEVERALRAHPSVAEAAVVARERSPGEPHLVAYVVGRGGELPTIAEMRHFLAQRIPAFMIPTAFVELESLPKTAGDKVDIQALAEPDWGQAVERAEFVPPRTTLESQVAAIWSEVLHVAAPGIHDDFFELGGNSLSATQVIARINREFAVWIPLRELFTSPTIAAMSRRVLEARESGARGSLPPIVPAPRNGPLPLSYGQEALWLIHQLQTGPSSYFIHPAARVRGPLDLRALERALNEILRRHESLRTTFVDIDGRPAQVVAPYTPTPLPVADLSGLSSQDREDEVRNYIRAQAGRPVDLSQGPLARIEVLRLSEDEHLILVGMHHIIYDGWSLNVLGRELMTAYRALAAGLPSPLSELPIQYADFAVWQRERLQGEVLERLRAYWLEQLDSLPTLEVPTDRARPAVRTTHSVTRRCRLSRPLSQAVRQLGNQHGTTTFMTLLTALEALLHRYSGQDDFAVGTPVAGRLRPETEHVIGYFVNTLVMRANVAGDPSFRELLGRVRETALAAFDYQELPFERLVEELNPRRDPSRHPVFQVLFVLQNAPHEQAELSDVEITAAGPPHGRSDFDLMISAYETPRGIVLDLDGNRDLFEEATVERMLSHLQVLLEAAVADPDRPISELPLMPEAERRQVLVDWNATAADYAEECVQQQFVHQAGRTPDAVALVAGDRRLTYGELNAYSNRLGRYLRKLGVEPATPVALCAPRNPRAAVGLFGILKAGGTFVPLDPSYPQDRLSYMLSDSRAPFLLTTQETTPLPDCQVQCVNLDAQAAAIDLESDENLPALSGVEDLAYIVYTSGSTGRPKGVALPGRVLANLIAWEIRRCGLSPRAKTLQFSPWSFDASLVEFFATLCCGGTLVLAPDAVRQDPGVLARFIAEEDIARVMLPAAELQPLSEAFLQSGQTPTGLRVVISTGEQLHVTGDMRALFQRLDGTWIDNQYGPSEAHVVTAHALRGAASDWPALPPIGRPIANTQIYILDRHRNPAPVGVPGELYIGGAGLARGYLNLPERTAERFVGNPFCDAPHSRLYRTGDLARYLPDGHIEFLGRMDDQVKIRGFRVEPGEIEAVLGGHPRIHQAVVAPQDQPAGGPRLVAYLIAAEGSELPTYGELRAFLLQHLPDYMVPAAFVPMQAMPLTPSGKIDRRALPAPDASRPELSAEYVEPGTELERTLARIWGDVLRVDRVGVGDDFFDLGGHSLLATSVVSRINRELNLRIPLRDLFESPTIAGFAERILKSQSTAAQRDLPPIQPVPRDGPLPLSFGQEALWLIHQMQDGPSPYHIYPAARVKGTVNMPALERAWNEVLRRHESLRTTYAEADGRPVQVIAPFTPRPLPVVDLSGLPAAQREEEVLRYVASQSQTPVSLAEGPLVRVEVLRLGPVEHVVLVGMHHILYDAWSLGVLGRDLLAAYRAFAAGFPSPLAVLPVQYADFAHWQRRRLQGEVFAGLRDYWLGELAGLPNLELPTDRSRPALRTTFAGIAEDHLPKKLSEAVARLARGERATTFAALLAAFEVLLRRYSGQEDFAVGTPVAGRLRPETEDLVGYFVNTLVLRADTAGDPTFRELLGRVRERALRAFEHQEMPFERLVEEVNPPRDLSRHPLFQVMFVLQNTPQAFLDVPELDVSGLQGAIGGRGAEFDLTLAATESDEGIALSLLYSTDLFDEATVARLLQNFRALLEGIVGDPDRRLSDLPLLADDQRRGLLAWARAETEEPPRATVHEIIRAQAARTPDAPAVIFAGKVLAYRELEEQSQRLAHVLQGMGVERGNRVGIHLERSADMLVAMLAVLKTGAAYVPLDPSNPPQRLGVVMEDAELHLILSESTVRRPLPAVSAKIVLLDALRAQDVGQPSRRLPDCTGDDLAYILYTSGSTGTPKGAMIPHRALINFLATCGKEQFVEPGDTVLALTTIAFDISIFELFYPLTAGASIVIAPSDIVRDGNQLNELMQAQRVAVVNATPSTIRMMLGAGWQPAPQLKVILGGEVLDPELAQRLLARGCRLWNVYGPTETTVWITVHPCQTVEGAIPIGRPTVNTEAYVVDGRGSLVPIGVPGELWIGGPCLAQGYWRRGELTADRFVPNPFDAGGGSKLYRSGDLVRWLADGNLEFLARIDGQVKIRGNRVELGEIEAALRRHPLVCDAAVLLRKSPPDEDRLTAYLVARGGEPLPVDELRRFLQQMLPEFMVPAIFVFLDAIPLTPSGKTDRKALPAPAAERPGMKRTFVAPQNDMQRQLAELWQDILDVRQVGIHDSFFDLGGNSLSAVQLAARISATFARKILVRDLFGSQTVAEQAELIALTAISAEISRAAVPVWIARGSVPGTVTRKETYRTPEHVTVEREPLDELIRAGRMAPVDSAALGYWSPWFQEQAPVIPALIERGLLRRRCLLSEVRQTPWGRIAVIILPMFESELYADPRQLVRHAVEGLEYAGSLGARVVSMTGLIPSAADNGRAVVAALGDRADWPKPTTGHATTATTVVFSLCRALREAGRPIEGECVAFVGLGSVGCATLRSTLASLPHPRKIILCDLFRKLEGLRAIQRELVETLGYRGPIRLLFSAGKVPDELYEATTIVGATNVPDVLDVVRLRPGTVIVDDSAPHIFSPLAAVERFETAADILFTEGGVLKMPAPIEQFRYLPPGIDRFLSPAVIEGLLDFDPLQLTGCVLSGLLSAQSDAIRPTIGTIDTEDLKRNHAKLTELGLVGADLHCGNYTASAENVEQFRSRFGSEGHRETAAPRQTVRTASERDAAGAAPTSLRAKSLVSLRAGGPGTPLFCIHGLGGNLARFLPLADQLSADRPIYGFQAQGLDPGQRPSDRVEAMAASYLEEMRTVQAQGPYLLAGWSLGGLIAIEAGRQLTASGAEAPAIALLDTQFSSAGAARRAVDDSHALQALAPQMGLSVKSMRRWPAERQWQQTRDRAAELGIDEDQLRRMVAVCKAHLMAFNAYSPQPYDAAVVLFRAREEGSRVDKRWNTACPQLRIEQVPGNHYSMLQKPCVEELAAGLRRLFLDAASP